MSVSKISMCYMVAKSLENQSKKEEDIIKDIKNTKCYFCNSKAKITKTIERCTKKEFVVKNEDTLTITDKGKDYLTKFLPVEKERKEPKTPKIAAGTKKRVIKCESIKEKIENSTFSAFTKYEKAIIQSILQHNEGNKGSSFQYIISYITEQHKVILDASKFKTQIKLAINRCLEKGYLVKHKNSYKLSKDIKDIASNTKIFKSKCQYEFGSNQPKVPKTKHVHEKKDLETNLEEITNQEDLPSS